jgi:hypothetical protein
MEGTRWKNVVYVRKTGKHGMETRENTGKHGVYVRKHGKTRIGGVSDSWVRGVLFWGWWGK